MNLAWAMQNRLSIAANGNHCCCGKAVIRGYKNAAASSWVLNPGTDWRNAQISLRIEMSFRNCL